MINVSFTSAQQLFNNSNKKLQPQIKTASFKGKLASDCFVKSQKPQVSFKAIPKNAQSVIQEAINAINSGDVENLSFSVNSGKGEVISFSTSKKQYKIEREITDQTYDRKDGNFYYITNYTVTTEASNEGKNTYPLTEDEYSKYVLEDLGKAIPLIFQQLQKPQVAIKATSEAAISMIKEAISAIESGDVENVSFIQKTGKGEITSFSTGEKQYIIERKITDQTYDGKDGYVYYVVINTVTTKTPEEGEKTYSLTNDDYLKYVWKNLLDKICPFIEKQYNIGLDKDYHVSSILRNLTKQTLEKEITWKNLRDGQFANIQITNLSERISTTLKDGTKISIIITKFPDDKENAEHLFVGLEKENLPPQLIYVGNLNNKEETDFLKQKQIESYNTLQEAILFTIKEQRFEEGVKKYNETDVPKKRKDYKEEKENILRKLREDTEFINN